MTADLAAAVGARHVGQLMKPGWVLDAMSIKNDKSELARCSGFVYVLTNPSMRGLVKIGFTRDKTELRAKNLSRHTGIPTEFEIAWDELVSDCVAVEKRVHERFAAFRVHERREFFRVPLRVAIAALREESESFRIDSLEISRTDVLPALEARFRRWLRGDLVGAYLGQTGEMVYFEGIFQPRVDSADLEVKRVELDDIYDDPDSDDPALSPKRPVAANARAFLVWDTYTICYFLPIFNDEAEEYFQRLERQLHECQRRNERFDFPFRP
ncbi:GIY-YIG nuclease family protein [Micromonospora chalcea]|uniref:GIY-YIG nuclease family protein n=1 Tax=Micromonospora chalcea TaxID=1874 RepID=UPI0033D97CE0